MQHLRRFLFDRCGNYGLMMAAIAVPILGVAGFAIDYYQASKFRAAFQNAADAAALTAAHTGATGNKYKTESDNVFYSNIGGLEGVVINAAGATVAKVDGIDQFTYTASFAMKSGLIGLFGIEWVQGKVTATAASGVEETEIALVLDSTGSMAGSNKMVELKAAVKLFADEFEGLQSKVKIAVVPFDTQVRLDNVAFGNPVMTTPANPFSDSTDCSTLSDSDDRQSCYDYKAAAATATGCKTITANYAHSTVTTKTCVRVVEGIMYTETTVTTTPDRGPETVQVSNTEEPFDWGPKATKPNDVVTANKDLLGATQSTWTGCVIDREQPYDTTSDSPTSADPATLYPTAYCARPALQPILPLTNNLNKVRNTANAMQPSGNTNITIGVQWGMEALTKALPLNGASGTSETRQFMIVLTDGVNTQNRWTKTSAAIDARTMLACDNAKAGAITIYTVRLVDGNAALLQSCASDPGKFFNVTSSNELSGVFRELAARIKKLRLIG